MSNVELEKTQSTCPVEMVLRGPNVAVGSLSFIKAVFEIQSEAAYDELGDYLREDDSVVIDALNTTGVKLNTDTARLLARSTYNCLKQRYLGNCAVSGHCTGRKINDARLEILGIRRYKSEQINQEV